MREQTCSFNLLVIVEKFSLSFSCDCCAKKNKQTKNIIIITWERVNKRGSKTKKIRYAVLGEIPTRRGGLRLAKVFRLVFITYINICILYIFLCLKFWQRAASARSFFLPPTCIVLGSRVFFLFFLFFMHK